LSIVTPQLIRVCPGCGKELAAGALACAECHTLVHGKELDSLAREARGREAKGEFAEAREIWMRALTMLPADSKQAEWMRDHLQSLYAVQKTEKTAEQNSWAKKLGPLGPIAVLLVKSKGLLAAVFKLKFLLSLASFVAVYWALYGWRFGVGLAACILIHELGHFVDIKRRGWPAEMPVFLPGLGAYVQWQAMGVTLRQRAQVSLAGPLAGWLAAVACLALYRHGGNTFWLGLARTGAVLNILNLIPVWVLDGGQAVQALARPERLTLLAMALGLWLFTGEMIFFLVAAGAAWCVFVKGRPVRSSWDTLIYYAAVLAALGAVLALAPEMTAAK
jgi:Zn-dependent protease